MGFIEWLKDLLCGREINELKLSLEIYKDVAVELELSNKELKEDNEKMKLELEPDTSKSPSWLDPDKAEYNPQVLVFEKGKSYWVSIDYKDIYAPSPSLEKLVEQKKLLSMPLNKKFNTIWTHVIHHLRYRYDQSDSWEYPTTTHYRKYGDCEDGTVYFLTLCRLAKIPADRVFNALGKMGDIGHSFPIVKMEDDKWYIMETTLNSDPDYPMLFKGSKYRAIWGVWNWRFGGGITNAKKQV